MANSATASKTQTPKTKAAPAKLPQNAGKLSTNAARRFAHATLPNLKTLTLLDGGNHEAAAIAKATGVHADAIDGHLDTLRRAKLIGSNQGASGAKEFHITVEGRKLWDAAKLVS